MEFKRWRPASGYRLSFFDHPEVLDISIPTLITLGG